MASSSPMRIPSGFTQDTNDQPLALIGQPNPFFYATTWDDFLPYDGDHYTVTVTGNGSVAAVQGGTGGRILFTTNSSTPLAADIAEIQSAAASYIMTGAKKTAFLARLQAASASAPVLQIGLIQETTTPATIVNGLVATRTNGGTAWTFQMIVAGSSVGSVVVADSVSGYTAATDIDIAMVYNARSVNGAAYGDVLCYLGAGLVGQVLNQNTGPTGPIARFTPTSLPTVALSPTLAMQSGAGASTTITADFFYAAQER